MDAFAGAGSRGDTERIESRNMAQVVTRIERDVRRILEILDGRGAAFLVCGNCWAKIENCNCRRDASGSPIMDGGEILSPEEQDCLVDATDSDGEKYWREQGAARKVDCLNAATGEETAKTMWQDALREACEACGMPVVSCRCKDEDDEQGTVEVENRLVDADVPECSTCGAPWRPSCECPGLDGDGPPLDGSAPVEPENFPPIGAAGREACPECGMPSVSCRCPDEDLLAAEKRIAKLESELETAGEHSARQAYDLMVDARRLVREKMAEILRKESKGTR